MKIKEFQALSPEDQFKEFEKILKAFNDAEAALSTAKTDLETANSTIQELKDKLGEETLQLGQANATIADLQEKIAAYGDYDTKIQLLKETQEELDTAKKIIDEQNKTIEEMDSEKGTETGHFITHKKKKLQVRVPKFKIKGKEYTIKDLKDNPEIEVAGKKKGDSNRKVGLTDYLLEVNSPILEIEE